MPRTPNPNAVPRELRPHFKEMARQGWKIRHNKHFVVTAPSGHTVTISGTPSSPYYAKRAISDLRKAGLDMSRL